MMIVDHDREPDQLWACDADDTPDFASMST